MCSINLLLHILLDSVSCGADGLLGDAHDAADITVIQAHLVEDEEEGVVGGLGSVFLLDAAESGEVDGLVEVDEAFVVVVRRPPSQRKARIRSHSTLRSRTGRTSMTSCSVRFVTSLSRRLILTRQRSSSLRLSVWHSSVTRPTSVSLRRTGQSNTLSDYIKEVKLQSFASFFIIASFISKICCTFTT